MGINNGLRIGERAEREEELNATVADGKTFINN
jgi:hypothetical protein